LKHHEQQQVQGSDTFAAAGRYDSGAASNVQGALKHQKQQQVQGSEIDTAAAGGGGRGDGGSSAEGQQLQPHSDDHQEGLGFKELVAVVPDLICCLETETGEAVATEALRYGLKVRPGRVYCTEHQQGLH
jgi:hypothetical protein